MLANVRQWCQRVWNGVRLDIVATIVSTAALLFIVWVYARRHEPIGAVLTTMATAAMNARNWYHVGKQRGAAMSLERKETVGR